MNEATPARTTEARETFLAHFPSTKRGTVANWFLLPIREQKTNCDPQFVVTSVLDQLYRRLETARASDQALDDASAAVEIIQANRNEALDFAAYYIAYERLPAAEREAIKQAEREQHKDAWMAEHPPSDRQLGYLQRLGYIGPPPTSMQEASEAIDRLLRRKGAK